MVLLVCYTGIVAPLPGRPADKQLSPPSMECGHKSTIGHSLATAQGAGDAPLFNEAGTVVDYCFRPVIEWWRNCVDMGKFLNIAQVFQSGMMQG